MQITIKNGKIKGEEKEGYIRFLGIPYGKATTGIRRFTPPEEADPWEDVLECTKWHKSTMQDPYDEKFHGEDSLRVNIWTPDISGRAPVIVWLHGGDYLNDGVETKMAYGDGKLYDMKTLCTDTGCVIVGVGFRMNVEGFVDLAHVDDRFTCNNGLRDIVLALHFVQDNISAFGGDPDNVTVAGQGSGGALALALLQVEEAQPLFSKIINASGGELGFMTRGEARKRADIWLDANFNPGADELAALEPKKLLQYNIHMASEFNLHQIDAYFAPVVDGEYLKDYPSEADLPASGKKLMIGWNAREGATYFGPMKLGFVYKTKSFLKSVLPYQSAGVRDRILKETKGFPSKDTYIRLYTERLVAVPSMLAAGNMSQSGDTYLYRYDYAPKALTKPGYGAVNMSEIPLLLDNPAEICGQKIYPDASEEDKSMGRRLRSYWASFARDGVPSPDWEKYDGDEQRYMRIDKESRMEKHPLDGREALYLEDDGKISREY